MQKSYTLSDDNIIPSIGLGTWQSAPNTVGKAVEYALMEAGYNHLDCASIYGNEKEIGKSLEKVFAKRKREDIFITSKLWNTDHDPVDVETACRKTLSDLHLEYLDLYLIHWGVAFQHGKDMEPIRNGVVVRENISIRETWKAMEKLIELSLVKSIGVANFNTTMIIDLLTYAKIHPVMNQIEVHPYNSQQELLAFCKQNNIVVTAYSPLARKGSKGVTGPGLFDEPIIKEISTRYKRPISQILLNWAVSRGTVAIPKSITPERIKENMQIYDFELSVEDLAQIDSLNQNLRLVDPVIWWGIPYFK